MDLKELAKPFPAEDIEWRVQRAGEKNGNIWAMVLAYVTNRAIMNRLDEVCGPENWQNDYKAGPSGGNLCGVSIWIEEKKEWVTKWDGADNSNIEATKGGLSDAMKRAGYQWGIGRYLYKLDTGFAKVHDGGAISTSAKIDGTNKYFKYDPPPLPLWALPQDHTQATKQAVKPTKQEKTPEAPPKQEKTQEEIDHALYSREMRECKTKNPILFSIVADNLSHKKDFSPADLSAYQCKVFVDEFIQRDK